MKTLLLILLCIVAAIALVALIRVHVRFVYGHDGVKLYVRALFFKLCVYPGAKKKDKKPKPEKQESKLPEKGGELPPLRKLIDLGMATFGKLRRKMRVDLLAADVVIASNDPFQTAMMFGGAGAGVGAALAALENIFNIKKKEIKVNADFTEKTTRVLMNIQASIRVGQAIAVALFVIFQFIKLQKAAKNADEEKENAQTISK